MRCDRCGREAVLLQPSSGLGLCADHLRDSLEARAKRTIRDHGWIRPGDRIGVALSGGPASSSLLHFLGSHFGMRRDISLVALTVNEGSQDLDRIEALARGMGIEWLAGPSGGEPGDSPPGCTWPRDRGLVSLARRAGATKLALGTDLGDEARSIFLRVIRGEATRLTGGREETLDGIPLIRPFTRVPGDELALYARLTVPGHLPPRDPEFPDEVEREAGRMLADYTTRHPSAPFGIVNLGEALAGHAGPRTGGSFLCDRCSDMVPSACPARSRGRETGHG